MTRGQMLSTPLTTRDEAAAFIGWLGDNHLSFHFDDSPETIINGPTGERIFTDEEVPWVNARVEEIFGFDWEEFECPFGFALTAWNLD
ncbi:hypothetical protein P67b_00037 [Ruegeria phage Tedan]|nr:hypothetical protein P67b_00037 [Ruegeria phage Tedan]